VCSGTVRSSCSTSDTRRDKNADSKFSVAIIRYAQSQICESQINQKYLGARQPMGLYRLAKIIFLILSSDWIQNNIHYCAYAHYIL
jgi:hypothetical protein